MKNIKYKKRTSLSALYLGNNGLCKTPCKIRPTVKVGSFTCTQECPNYHSKKSTFWGLYIACKELPIN